jgi:energy-coupling factor transporter ATP-binding protein EcfA2
MKVSARPLLDNAADAELFLPRPEAERIEQNCRDGINTLVTGARGMGKTSLLRHVAYVLRERDSAATFVDGRPARNAPSLVWLLGQELGRTDPAIPYRLGRLFDATDRAVLREGELINAVRALASDSANERRREVVLVDSPPPGPAAHQLFGRLRDELWQLPYTWVVAVDENRRGELLTPPADVFFEDVVELQPLSDPEQAELIGRRLEPGEVTPWRLGGPDEGNPRTLLEATRLAARHKDPDKQLRAIVGRETDVSRLGRAASMLYAELGALGPSSASDEELLNRLGWSRQRAAQVLADLEASGFVRATMRPGPSGRPRKTFEIVPPVRA